MLKGKDLRAGRSFAAVFIGTAPFSAIMIVGALVFIEVTVGMTEASISRRMQQHVSPLLVVQGQLGAEGSLIGVGALRRLGGDGRLSFHFLVRQ